MRTKQRNEHHHNQHLALPFKGAGGGGTKQGACLLVCLYEPQPQLWGLAKKDSIQKPATDVASPWASLSAVSSIRNPSTWSLKRCSQWALALAVARIFRPKGLELWHLGGHLGTREAAGKTCTNGIVPHRIDRAPTPTDKSATTHTKKIRYILGEAGA